MSRLVTLYSLEMETNASPFHLRVFAWVESSPHSQTFRLRLLFIVYQRKFNTFSKTWGRRRSPTPILANKKPLFGAPAVLFASLTYAHTDAEEESETVGVFALRRRQRLLDERAQDMMHSVCRQFFLQHSGNKQLKLRIRTAVLKASEE